MRESIALLIAAFLGAAILPASSAGLEYLHCPDCSKICAYEYYCTLSCPSPVCNDEEDVSSYQILYAAWNSTDVPFQGSEFSEGTVDVTGAEAILSLESNKRNTAVKIFSWNCDYSEFEEIETVYIGEELETRRFDVTDYFLPCRQEYMIAIKPQFINTGKSFSSARVTISRLDLNITYGFMRGTLYNNLDTNLPSDNSMGKYDVFEAYDSVECSGGDCNKTLIVLQYYNESLGRFMAIPDEETDGIPFYTEEDNPYIIGYLHDGDSVQHSWAVHAARTGEYAIRSVAHSSDTQIDNALSKRIPVIVKAGTVSVDNAYFFPNPIEKGDYTVLYASVSCGEYYCGNIRMYAKNGTGSIPSEDDYFIMSDDNPQDCGVIQPEDSCEVSWKITPKITGEYPDIYVLADSDEPDVAYAERYPDENLYVKEPPPPDTGTISITGAELQPSVIDEGGSTVLKGIVSCSNGPCGMVSVYARYSYDNIGPSGDISTPSSNPQYCGNMNDGDSCNVLWDITGNSEGTYEPITMYAESDNQDINPATSDRFSLIVEKPVGSITLSAILDTSQINITESSRVSASAGCSGGYCGSVALSLEYSDGTLVGSEGNLSTPDPNPASCISLPCNHSWNIYGNYAGLYEIKVRAESDEGIYNETDNMGLYVNDPEEPPEPVLHISSIQDISEVVGHAFQVSAEISCFVAGCGGTIAYLQFMENGKWRNLTSLTPLSTDQNEHAMIMMAGDSNTIEWTINSSIEGAYSMRAVAQSDNAAAVYEEFSADIAAPDIMNLQVLSPSAGTILSRGDTLYIEAIVTKNGEPVEGLVPTASFSGGLSPKIALDDRGGGRYSNSVTIPSGASGEYTITFDAGGISRDVMIMIDPSLDVTLETDKQDYETNEYLTINGTVLKRGEPAEADALIDITCNGWNTPIYNLKSDAGGKISYRYRLPRDMPPGSCSINLTAKDNYENSGYAAAEINISKSEMDVYNITFVLPASKVFATGDVVNISLFVMLGDDFISDADVACTDAYGNFNINLNRTSSGEYISSVPARRPYRGNEWNLRCIAETDDGFFGTGFVSILVRPVITINVLEPEDRMVEKGESVHFEIQAFIDNTPLEDGNVYITMRDDIMRLNHTISGIYKGDYVLKEDGEFEFRVFADDGMGNSGNTTISIESVSVFRINWLGAGLIIAGAITLAMLLFFYKTERGRNALNAILKGTDRRKILKDKIRDLEKRVAAINKAKENAEIEYYQRKLTESEFRRMLEDYEEELLKLNAEIREFSDELRSLEDRAQAARQQ